MAKPTLKFWRRLTQSATALAFVAIPWLNTREWEWIQGNLLSLRLDGLVLADPLAAWQVWLGSGAITASLLWGAALVLGLAALLGTSFCAWLCPFGLISEWGQALSARWRGAGQPWGRPGLGFMYKAGLVGLGLLAAALGAGPLLNQLSLPGWYTRAWQMVFIQGHWTLALLVMAALAGLEAWRGRRLWCRYLCPQSWLLACAQLLNRWRLKVSFDPARCRCGQGASPCQRACSLGLNPKAFAGNLETDCTNCGDCVVVCQDLGQALGFSLAPRSARPGRGPAPER